MVNVSIVTYHTELKPVINIIKTLITCAISKIYVIDNSSNDSLRELSEMSSKITYIHSANLGYGAGHNIAIRKSIDEGAMYHVVINPDVSFDKDAVELLIRYMNSNQDCGLVMPKILYPNGEIQRLCKLLPTPFNLIGRRFLPSISVLQKYDEIYELGFTKYDKTMSVPSLSGCFMFMRVDILKQVGGFDERYFMYAEDLDLCRRIGEVSKTIFYPEAIVYHEYARGSYKNKKLLKYHIISVIKYFNKWGWFFDNKRKHTNKECLQKLRRYVS